MAGGGGHSGTGRDRGGPGGASKSGPGDRARGGGGKGSSREDADLARQLDKVKGLPGSRVGGWAGNGGSNLDPNGGYRNSPFGRPGLPAAVTPNFPNASPSVALGGLLDGLLSASPTGFAGMMGRVGMNAINGGPFSTGLGMDAALANGGTLGAPGKPSGVGHDWSSDNQYTSPGLLSAGNLPPTAPLVQPQAIPGVQQTDAIKKRGYALGLTGVPGPTPYSYQTAKWL